MSAKPFAVDEIAMATGHRLRSEILDLFAALEQAVASKLFAAGVTVPAGSTLSQRVDRLAKVAFRHPAKAKDRIDAVRQLIPCRNDIVHSRMEVLPRAPAITDCGKSGVVHHYLFQNAGTAPLVTGSLARLFSAEELKALAAQIRIATKLLADQQLKPQPSPQPAPAPKPAAAASG